MYIIPTFFNFFFFLCRILFLKIFGDITHIKVFLLIYRQNRRGQNRRQNRQRKIEEDKIEEETQVNLIDLIY